MFQPQETPQYGNMGEAAKEPPILYTSVDFPEHISTKASGNREETPQLVYAELDLATSDNPGASCSIHRKDPPTEYTGIDFSRSVLPKSSVQGGHEEPVYTLPKK